MSAQMSVPWDWQLDCVTDLLEKWDRERERSENVCEI